MPIVAKVEMVPMPDDGRGNKGHNIKWPWRELGVGDGSSFLMLGKKIYSASSCANEAAKRMGNGCKFTCRTVEGGVRIWRIS